MPQASEELRRRWDENSAYEYLTVRGFICKRGVWYPPVLGHTFVDEESNALAYLRDEWDEAYQPTFESLIRGEKQMSRPEEYRHESPWQQAERHHLDMQIWVGSTQRAIGQLTRQNNEEHKERRDWWQQGRVVDSASRRKTSRQLMIYTVTRITLEFGIFAALVALIVKFN